MISGKACVKAPEDPFYLMLHLMPWWALMFKIVHVDLEKKTISTAQHPEQPPWDDNSERNNQTQMDS